MLRSSNTPEAAGYALAKALGETQPQPGRIYAAELSLGPTFPNWPVETMSAMRFGGTAARLLACRRGRKASSAAKLS
jgi:hypothetical protein